jgi:hypothetical protein
MRHAVLYAEAFWRRNRNLARLAVLSYGGVTAFEAYLEHGLGPQTRQSLLIEAAFVALLIFPHIVRVRSYLEATAEGLAVQGLARRTLIPYTDIERVRVMPLRRHFEDKRERYRRGTVRELLESDAVFVRLRSDSAERVRRLLGPRDVDDRQLAYPVSSPEALVQEMRPHLAPVSAAEALPARGRRRR